MENRNIYIQGDILNIDKGIVCQQVNCRGVMGSGLAKSIRDKWPIVYNEYRKYYMEHGLRLGKVLQVKVTDNLHVANLCAQDRYGRDKQYTDYYAMEKCLSAVKNSRDKYYAETNRYLPIYIPYGMGCGLAGGKWRIVGHLISIHIPDATIVSRVKIGILG